MTVKLSVSLPDRDVAYIDELAASHDGNRSAVIHDLVRIVRELHSEDDYAAAFDEWGASGDAAAWESTSGDGLGTDTGTDTGAGSAA